MRKAFLWSRKKREPEKDVVLRGRKVILRARRIDDVPDDYRWRADEELARLDATRPLDMPCEAFLRYAKEEIASPTPWSRRFAIDTLDGKHIGSCMYYDIDHKRGMAELGIVVGEPEYQGRGYGTDAVDSLLGYVYGDTDLKRIYLHTLEWNHRARKSFAKSGFREVGRVRRNGKDFIQMEISQEEWERHRRETERATTTGAGPDEAADGESEQSAP